MKIIGEALAVPCYSLIEAARLYVIEHRQVCIQYDLLATDEKDELRDVLPASE